MESVITQLSSAALRTLARFIAEYLGDYVKEVIIDAQKQISNPMMYKEDIAKMLHTTPDAIRKRFERNQLPGRKDKFGSWYCLKNELSEYLQGNGENTEK